VPAGVGILFLTFFINRKLVEIAVEPWTQINTDNPGCKSSTEIYIKPNLPPPFLKGGARRAGGFEVERSGRLIRVRD